MRFQANRCRPHGGSEEFIDVSMWVPDAGESYTETCVDQGRLTLKQAEALRDRLTDQLGFTIGDGT